MSKSRPTPPRVPLSQVSGSQQRPPSDHWSPQWSPSASLGDTSGTITPIAPTPSVSSKRGTHHEEILRSVSEELMRLSKLIGSLVRTSRTEDWAPSMLQKSAAAWQHDALVNGLEKGPRVGSPALLAKPLPVPGLELDLGPAVRAGATPSPQDSPKSSIRAPSGLQLQPSTSTLQLQLQKSGSNVTGLVQAARASVSNWYELQGQSMSSIFGDNLCFESPPPEAEEEVSVKTSEVPHRHLDSINSDQTADFHNLDSMMSGPPVSGKETVFTHNSLVSSQVTTSGPKNLKLANVWQKMLEDKKKTSTLRSASALPLPDRPNYTFSRDVKQKPSSRSDDDRFTLQGWLVAHPTARRRLAWDLLGMMLLSYDLFVVPLQAFDPGGNDFTTGMSWTALMFWTLDVPFTFLTGYQAGEFVEMNLKKIAMHYFRTWLVFDVCVLVVDWMTSVANEVGSGASLVRLLKGLRFVRVLRLLRLLKAGVLIHEFLERNMSDMVLILANIAKLIVFVLFANHVIACVWFAIGVMEAFDRSWVKVNDMEGEGNDIYYRYFTSLHWSMTQFTPASMEVVPANTLERVYTVTVLLFAMITFSSLVSSITNAATQLRNLNKQRLEEYAALRRYLNENKVSAELASTIWGYISAAWDKSQRRFHESDVVILGLLPRSLRSELQHQVYSPILSVHPFFGQLGLFYPMMMQKLYRHALSEVSLATGQELFSPGERGDTMFFVISGNMWYHHAGNDDSKVSWRHCASGVGINLTKTITSSSTKETTSAGVLTVGEDDWIAEPALWIDWHHIGRLSARQQSELLGLKSSKFKSTLLGDGNPLPEAPKYAKLWVEHMNNQRYPITDIYLDVMPIENLVSEAFFPEGDQEEVFTSTLSENKKKQKKGKRRMSNRRRSFTDIGIPRFSRVSTSTANSWKSGTHTNSMGHTSTLDSNAMNTNARRSVFGAAFSKVRLGGGVY